MALLWLRVQVAISAALADVKPGFEPFSWRNCIVRGYCRILGTRASSARCIRTRITIDHENGVAEIVLMKDVVDSGGGSVSNDKRTSPCRFHRPVCILYRRAGREAPFLETVSHPVSPRTLTMLISYPGVFLGRDGFRVNIGGGCTSSVKFLSPGVCHRP